MRKTILIFVSIAFAAMVTETVVFSIWPIGQIFGMYRIEDSVAVESPDHRYVATGYHLIGSAVVHSSTLVEMKAASFFAGETEAVFIIDNLKPFTISWTNKNELTIQYSGAEIYLQKSNWKDVTIKYLQK